MMEQSDQGSATLCVDVGATSIKLCVLGPTGEVLGRRSARTPRPLDPDGLVDLITARSGLLPLATRAAVGFPGVVREGIVHSAANLALSEGAGSSPDVQLERRWAGFDLAGSLSRELGLEVRCANDADLAALACSEGTGVELTVTLGSGVGTGLVVDGRLAPHLELSELPLMGAESLDALVGEPARKLLSDEEWNQRVRTVLRLFDRVVGFDRCWLAGGNARRVRRNELGPLLSRIWIVSEPVGLLGGPRLFDY